MKTLRLIAAAFAASIGFTGIASAERLQLIDPPSQSKSAVTAGDKVHGKGVVRVRDATPNFAALAALRDALRAQPGVPQEIELPIFADKTLVLAIDKVEENGGMVSYFGHVANEPLSTATIFESNGQFGVHVVSDGKGYNVVFRGDKHEAREIDRSAYDGHDEPSVPTPPLSATPKADLAPTAAADDGSTIDVMVLYSPAARSAAGGTAAIQNQINLAIATTNQAYANGALVQRVRLVHAEEVAYAEPSTPALDSTLNDITDGVAPFQNVAALRNQYGADLVAMWVENGGPWCGIGWLMTTVSTSFSPNGYHVGTRDCEVNYDTMAHEMGHNMGLEHDVYVSPVATHPTAQPYAHGYVNTTARFRTIMAYQDACSAVGVSCGRINQFSSPNYQLNGYPIGTASGADAGRMLNETRTTVANFKTAVVNAPPTIALAASAYTVAETAGSVTLTVTRSGTTTGSATVSWTTANGTALAGQDFGAAGVSSQRSGTITFAAGETSKTIVVPVIDDTTIESNETFTVALSNPSNATLGATASSTVTITSNDSTFALATTGVSVNENGPNVTLRISRTGNLGTAASVTYTAANGTAVAGTDYGTLGSASAPAGVVAFAANQAYRDITIGPVAATAPYIPVINDTLAEPSKAFTVTLSSPSAGTTLAGTTSATVTIASDDVAVTPGPNTLQFAAATAIVNEGANLVLSVRRTGTTTGTASVKWTAANGSAVAGTDFGAAGNATPPSGTLSWAANDAAAKSIVIPVINDATVEGTKTFTVGLSNPVGTSVTVGTIASVNVTINDNDSGLAFVAPVYTVAENGGSVTLQVKRVGPSTAAATVHWATANGSANAGQDFGTLNTALQRSGTLSWLAGDVAVKSIVIPILNDAIAEGPETFTVTLSTPSTGILLSSPATATVTINDDDAPPSSKLSFSQPKYVVLENGGAVTLTVNRVDAGGGFGASASVRYATVAGTALATSDFTSKAGTLTWAAGDSSPKTIVVPITNDAIAEPPESFKVTLSTASAGTGIATPEATVLILDDDEAFPPDGAIPSDWVAPAGAQGSWHVSNDPGAYEGALTLKSDSIDDNERAEIQVARTFAAGTVSFRAKVSSEAGFDLLRFYVDGVPMASWSGTTSAAWQLYSYTLPAGAHTLKWAYEKDASASVGQDAAWIDAVVLP